MHLLYELKRKKLISGRDAGQAMFFVGTAPDLQTIMRNTDRRTNFFYTIAQMKSEAVPPKTSEECNRWLIKRATDSHGYHGPWRDPVETAQWSKARKEDFLKLEYLYVDIDKINPVTDLNDVIRVVEDFFSYGDSDWLRYYVQTGHGLQALFRISTKSLDFFDRYSAKYKAMCIDLDIALRKAGIDFGEVDSSVFEPSRVFRVPCSINDKSLQHPDWPAVDCKLIETLGDEIESPV